jgi:hypothetical protein
MTNDPLPSDLEPTTTSPDDDTATHPQPHEQLLVGWTAGGMRGWTTDDEEQQWTRNDGHGRMNDDNE